MAETHPLKLAYAREHPGELAAYLASRGVDAIAAALEELPPEVAAALVAKLPHAHAIGALAAQDDRQLGSWLNAATVDDALVLLLHMEENRRMAALQSLSGRGKRRTLERLMLYPRDTVGALVNPAIRRLNLSLSVNEALGLLRDDTPGPEESVWLVDDAGIYRGLLDLSGTLMARSDNQKLDSFLLPLTPLRAETSLRNAQDFHEWLHHAQLPVTDHLGHLLGSLSRARLMSALAESKTAEQGLVQGVADLAQQYFRVMGACLGDLLGKKGPGS